jgi:hypothetical protein
MLVSAQPFETSLHGPDQHGLSALLGHALRVLQLDVDHAGPGKVVQQQIYEKHVPYANSNVWANKRAVRLFLSSCW